MDKSLPGHPTETSYSYLRSFTEKELRPKREKMKNILEKLGLIPIVPDGGYFMVADASKYKNMDFGNDEESWDMKCKKLFWL